MYLRSLLSALGLAAISCAVAVTPGAIDADMLQRLRDSYKPTAADKAIHNALNTTDIRVLAASADNRANFDNQFNYRVHSRGITDQKI